MTAVRRRVVAVLVVVAVAWPALLIAGQWPRWWTWIASEQTPMTWLQSVVLVLSGAAALAVGLVLGRHGASRRERRAWGLIAVGTGLLALDERFALHERVRDGILAPRGVEVPFLPWVAPGDFLVLGLAMVGLVVLPQVWAAVAVDRAARTALGVAVVCAVVAVGIDSIDPATWTVQQERLQQTAEEVIELGCGLALLACVVLRLLGALEGLVPAGEPSGSPASDDSRHLVA